jgi:hypothetical protein
MWNREIEIVYLNAKICIYIRADDYNRLWKLEITDIDLLVLVACGPRI